MAAALLLSCAGEEGSRDTMPPPLFSVDTRAGAGTTYRISAYSTEAHSNQFGLIRSATYYLKAAGDKSLTGCTLTDAGAWVNDTPDEMTATFNGLNGYCYLTCVSPGIAPVDGGFPCTPGTTPFLVATRGSTQLGTYGALSLGDLVDYRSRVGFRFYKKKDPDSPLDPVVEPFTIKDNQVQLVGAGAHGEAVKLYPLTRQVVASAAPRSLLLTATPVTDPPVVDGAGNPEYYNTATGSLLYIASAMYAPKEELRVDQFNNTPSIHLKESGYLYMLCTLVQGGREIPVRLPMTITLYNLRPLNTYYFNITVMSNYVNATVDVYDGTTLAWQDGGDDLVVPGDPTSTIEIGTWHLGPNYVWEEFYLGQTID
jgi:hypothetical protein